jgi:hypothetical protein
MLGPLYIFFLAPPLPLIFSCLCSPSPCFFIICMNSAPGRPPNLSCHHGHRLMMLCHPATCCFIAASHPSYFSKKKEPLPLDIPGPTWTKGACSPGCSTSRLDSEMTTAMLGRSPTCQGTAF